jgi:hypothetical protein
MGRGGHSDDEGTPYDQSLEEVEFMRGACAAAQRGDLSALKRSVERRPNLLADDGVGGNSGYAPLHYAAREGHVDCVEFLLSKGARVDQTTTAGRATALHRAAFTGHPEVLEKLVLAGADASLRDADDETALHKAASRGHHACVALLLRACPSASNVRDRRGAVAHERVREDDAKTREAFEAFFLSTESNTY